MKHIVSLIIGILFGIALSKALATDYNAIIDMFLFRNFHLYGVIATAIVTVTVGVYIFKKIRLKDVDGKPIEERVGGGFSVVWNRLGAHRNVPGDGIHTAWGRKADGVIYAGRNSRGNSGA